MRMERTMPRCEPHPRECKCRRPILDPDRSWGLSGYCLTCGGWISGQVASLIRAAYRFTEEPR